MVHVRVLRKTRTYLHYGSTSQLAIMTPPALRQEGKSLLNENIKAIRVSLLVRPHPQETSNVQLVH